LVEGFNKARFAAYRKVKAGIAILTLQWLNLNATLTPGSYYARFLTLDAGLTRAAQYAVRQRLNAQHLQGQRAS
jgi:hypothetical protein